MAKIEVRVEKRCKICSSKNVLQINQMIIDEKQPVDIMNAFPEDNLNHANIINHKNHFQYKDRAIAEYKVAVAKEQASQAIDKVVTEIRALDETYTKAYDFLMNADFAKEHARKLEVVSEMMFRAIQTKAELCKGDSNPGKELENLFSAVLKTAQKKVKEEPKDVGEVIDASFTEHK